MRKKYIKMKLPEGPLYGSKEAFEKGYYIAQPGMEFLVEDQSREPSQNKEPLTGDFNKQEES